MYAIRPAIPADVPAILGLIRDLATFEREADKVVATEADLLRDGFALAPDSRTPLVPAPPIRFRALIADWDQPGATSPESAGFALFFTSYST